MDGEIVFSIVGVLVLLVISAIFSGSETALTAVSRARMHQFEHRGVSKADKVNQMINCPERLIGAILLGNNLVNILDIVILVQSIISQ